MAEMNEWFEAAFPAEDYPEAESPVPDFGMGRDSPDSWDGDASREDRLASAAWTEGVGVASDGMPTRAQSAPVPDDEECAETSPARVEAELGVLKLQEELLECREAIGVLDHEREQSQQELLSADRASNRAAADLVHARLQRILQELENESRLEESILAELERARYEMAKAELQEARLPRSDRTQPRSAGSVAQKRREHEAQQLAVLKARQRRAAREADEARRTSDERQQHADAQARLARARVAPFLRDALDREARRRAASERVREREMEDKMKDVVTLKDTIGHTREVMRAKQAARRAHECTERDRQEQLRAVLEAEGRNADVAILTQQRVSSMQLKERMLLAKRRRGEMAIVAKLGREEREQQRKRTLLPQLFPHEHSQRTTRPRRSKALAILRQPGSFAPQLRDLDPPLSPRDEPDDERVRSPSDSESDETDSGQPMQRVDEEGDESVATPEFHGLWTGSGDVQQSRGHEQRGRQLTKMEEDMRRRQLATLRQKQVQTQVAAGRTFHGQPFSAEPGVVHFKDFVPGRTYSCRVLLTNVSYAINSCRVLDLSARLKDFVSVTFHPPGQLSPGMACVLVVHFQPRTNDDLAGEVRLQARNGAFSLPVTCSTRKCLPSLSPALLDLGAVVVGETRRGHVVLSNAGALDTTFAVASSRPVDDAVPELELGQVRSGVLAGGASVRLEVVFRPLCPGPVSELFHVTFGETSAQQLDVSVRGESLSIPVEVERSVVDMGICQLDRLYQDGVLVHNRSGSALKVTFSVPDAVRDCVEVLPRTAFVQARSSFSAQVKLFPRASLLPLEATSGELEVSVSVHVSQQTRVVSFVLVCVLCPSELEADVHSLSFGCCTLHESVLASVHLRNTSLVTQEFGFVSVPDVLDVQPNDGFGLVLPQESVRVDVLFRPSRADEYSGELVCKTRLGRELRLRWSGVGVLPPLELSCQAIHLPATCVFDTSHASFFVLNRHVDTDEFSHAVARIGKGAITPVGPTAFEFVLPDACPLQLSPRIGVVRPGERCQVHVTFRPVLSEQDVLAQARLAHADGPAQPTDEQRELHKAKATLLRAYEERLLQLSIPCLLGRREARDEAWSVANSLHLELVCPSIRPELVVISASGSHVIDFGAVCLHQTVSRTLSVHNISSRTLTLTQSLLAPDGPFEMVNAWRPLPPEASHSIVLSFTPSENSTCLENLEVRSGTSTLTVTLLGRGVAPAVEVLPADSVVDFGAVLVGDTATRTLQLRNPSPLAVDFEMALHDGRSTGVANALCRSVFNVAPFQGTLLPGESKELRLTFSPDHASSRYGAEARIILAHTSVHWRAEVRGACFPSSVYVLGGDSPPTHDEHALPLDETGGDDSAGRDAAKPLLLTFEARHGGAVSRHITIGCVKPALKKAGNAVFQLDSVQAALKAGFSFEPAKGSVEAGTERSVTVTWNPAAIGDVSSSCEEDVVLSTKGDVAARWRLLLRGFVSVSDA